MAETPLLGWVLFNGFVLAMLALDLGVFHRRAHAVSMKEALTWSAVWIALAMVFNGLIYFWKGGTPALEFLTGYLIEKSLSVDNIFVFVLLFGYFRVLKEYEHRILFWGILGALLMRAGFIAAGVTLIDRFHAVIYVFGAFLVYTGFKMWFSKGLEIHPEQNPVLKAFKRIMPVTSEIRGQRFFIQENGKRLATPLFVVLLLVETSDIIFAVDSIPAILAVTRDPFLVFTSNIFAILGLRSLYFALSGIIQKFEYLHHALAFVLGFVGLKMLLADLYKIPVAMSLGVIIGALALGIWRSMRKLKKTAPII